MRIGIPKENLKGETRVALIPPMISSLTRNKHEVLVESGAGTKASFTDEEYKKAGANVINDKAELYRSSEVVFKVQPPQMDTNNNEATLLQNGSVLIGFLAPLDNPTLISTLAEKNITSFAMEFIPRITRAQSMDALSSMATIVGYKAVLIAADHLGKIFPMLMTAAGTIPASNVLVLGAGVAGLQAIATAKRLGAKVEAFDPRPAVKEQVQSLGAQFVEMEVVEDVETKGGYAKEQSEEFLRKEQEAIAGRLPKTDVVVTTAQVFGKRAPLLITEDMVKLMRPGSVIIDIAAGQGGNCALSKPDEVVENYGVTIYGHTNLAATVPVHASQMYAKNLINLFNNLYKNPETGLDFNDEITKGACMTHDGKIMNEMVRNAVQNGGSASG